MKAAVVLISEKGKAVADKAVALLNAEIISRTEVPEIWNSLDCLVFVGAMGICVRTVAPLLKDKHTDPAVICVDSNGKEVVSVLSGHVGGANEIAGKLALALGAHPVITTQTDGSGLWPLDLLAKRFGWAQQDEDLNRQIFLYAEGKPTAILLEVEDEGTRWLEENPAGNISFFYRFEDIDLKKFSLLLTVSPRLRMVEIPNIQWTPRCVHIGIGLARQAGPADKVIEEIFKCLSDNGICKDAIANISSADIKKDEPVIKELEEEFSTIFYDAGQLSEISVPSPSEVVEKCVGTPSVSEASAILSSGNANLLLPKQKGSNWTVAAAVDSAYVRQAHIEIVGAGPGDPDLVSVRGRKMLQKADLILYAGSLVPKELTLCAKPGATVVSSADMDLEQQCALMKEFYDRGKFIVRLHTGDPCIFGAIQEQMAFFDKHDMSYHITPGISSFLAAAAELRSQFTIPERCQTIILTRGEGRTPMPEKEKLHLLARSNSTMCIFLSAAIVDDVQKELLMEYPEDTPVAACYHLTWPDQKIYRGVLRDLARIVKDNHLTLTTMLVVGEAIDNRQGLSELYSRNFTHLFRKARE
ncbi:MAG: precorrin-4 C(11)-methyltransferase [Bacteroidales bacterium]|nr:precorrin-4 C(11)-methyltransferase [Bacteroidales bacterium]